MDSNETDQKSIYSIRVKGVPVHSLADWLGDLQIIPQEGGTTLLVGSFADQPALRGLLDQLWNLNFTLLSVEMIENQTEQNSGQTEQERISKATREGHQRPT